MLYFDRISAMLARLGGRGYLVQEDRLLSNRQRIDSEKRYLYLCRWHGRQG